MISFVFISNQKRSPRLLQKSVGFTSQEKSSGSPLATTKIFPQNSTPRFNIPISERPKQMMESAMIFELGQTMESVHCHQRLSAYSFNTSVRRTEKVPGVIQRRRTLGQFYVIDVE
ncbi:hypothetical protein LENED_005149 [Lentinula edodes]|uniref:Uncharacterized protein n=1 Tax=Lentinula edodes TaxID=5353 RepID=A0A1Q3E849_LENED|nr:hypothetical protein LENED_005149 [Lentinula edodes]